MTLIDIHRKRLRLVTTLSLKEIKLTIIFFFLSKVVTKMKSKLPFKNNIKRITIAIIMFECVIIKDSICIKNKTINGMSQNIFKNKTIEFTLPCLIQKSKPRTVTELHRSEDTKAKCADQ